MHGSFSTNASGMTLSTNASAMEAFLQTPVERQYFKKDFSTNASVMTVLQKRIFLQTQVE
jgi:hypothetical protein